MGIECELIYDGVSSRDIGVTVEGFPGAVMPKKDLEVTTIPGRNGALVYDYGTYANYTQNYTIHWREVGRNARITEWLQKPGYHKLEDSFHEDHYRLAYVGTNQNLDNRMQVLQRMPISFECRPQWFKKKGENPITINESGTVLLNTGENALPLITVNGNGSGTLNVDDCTITINDIPSGGIIIDCELQDAYSPDKLQNLNSKIILNDNRFPVLKRGKTTITFTSGIKSVIIIPRWWDLL